MNRSILIDVLSETDFMYSTKEPENKDAECIFCNGKFSEDEREENWVKCFSCSLWVHLECITAENTGYICDFYKYK